MLNEKELRRAEFLGGRPVTLADGQEWTVPVASRVFILDESAPDGFKTVKRFGGKDDEVFASLWNDCENASDDPTFIRSTLRIMLHMLQLNYDIDAATAAPLMPISFQVDQPDPIRETFLSAARGQATEEKKTPSDDGLL